MKYFIFLMILPIMAFAVEEPVSKVQNPHGKLMWDCSDCHTAESWTKIRSDMNFDHSKTGFNLIGAHKQTLCAGCHKSPVFSRVGTACLDCHGDHHEGQLGTNCEECHTPRDWQPRQDLLMKHAERGFPLTGAHAVADCESCHIGSDRLEYAGTPTDCESCHINDAQLATDPDHTQAAFRSDCQRCHDAAFGTWARTTYEHPVSFPLTGSHSTIACSACHASGFAGTSPLCYSCHETEYASTDDPNHQDAGFSTECQLCHTTVAWQPAYFDHNNTSFPLQGAHTTVTCLDCHQSGYAGTPTTCVPCHQQDFDGAADPNHIESGFSTECQTCHSFDAWQPATFDHNNTSFPLQGAHLTVACLDCHQSGYAGTPSTCVPCHQQDYDNTTDPDHTAAQFPTECQTCHGFNTWQPANWDHDAAYFPIYSGSHQGRWDNCVECHTIPSDYSTFDCTACHAHNQTDTDSHHNEVRNYQYASSACYTCHPTGRGGD